MDHSDPLERATQRRPRGEIWTDDQFREARDKDLAERTAAIRSTVIAALSCLLLAALLTSGKIVQVAERQEFGDSRDRNLAAAEGLDRVANFLSLNRPYDAILDLRNAGENAGERVDTIDEVAVSSSLAAPPAVASDISQTATSTSTTQPEPRRLITPDKPLRVYVAGDSQAEYLGQALTTESADLALDLVVDDRISTSLARPDYFNWPAELANQIVSDPPEAVVLFIGANDHQDMTDVDGNRLVEGTEAWQVEWTSRLEIALDLLAGDGRHVYWVTQPPMRDGELNEGVIMINALAAPVVAERDHVSAIEIWQLFGGEAGFIDRLPNETGELIDARVGDGVHLTRAAASWVAELVFAAMAERWDFSAN